MLDKYLIAMGWKNCWNKWDKKEVAIDVTLFTFTLGIIIVMTKAMG